MQRTVMGLFDNFYKIFKHCFSIAFENSEYFKKIYFSSFF